MQQKKKRSGPVAIISILLLGVVIFGGVYYGWSATEDIFQPVSSSNDEKAFEIKEGESTTDIAQRLQDEHLIRNALAFRVWAKIKDLDTKLQAGVYTKLSSSMTISQIIDEFLHAQPNGTKVVLKEGLRIEEVANILDKADPKLTNFDKQKFLDYMKNSDSFPDKDKYPFLATAPQDHRTMEGFLFPETYYPDINSSTETIINTFLKQTAKIFSEQNLEQQAKAHNMNIYQFVTLASIVEREARQPDERPMIAGVYVNRLNNVGETVHFLNADPTVQYAEESDHPPADGKYWKPLEDSAKNIAPESPWNTYTNKYLPPTPICSPGLSSLQGAANYSQHDYFYFYHDKDLQIHYAKTMHEFEQLQVQFPLT